MTTHGPLYYVALKCRDGATRRKAIDLLIRSPRREGMWDGYVVGQFARHIAAVEEANAISPGPEVTCDQIPEPARFSDVTLGFSDDFTRGRLYLGRFRHESTGRWIVHETEFDFIQSPWLDGTGIHGESRYGALNPALFARMPSPEVRVALEVQEIDSYEESGVGIARKSSSLNSYPTPGAAELAAVKRKYVAERMAQAGDRFKSFGPADHTVKAAVPPKAPVSYTEGLSHRVKKGVNVGAEEWSLDDQPW